MNMKRLNKKIVAFMIVGAIVSSSSIAKVTSIEAGFFKKDFEKDQKLYTDDELKQLAIDCYGEDYDLFYGWTQEEIDRFYYLDDKYVGKTEIPSKYIPGNKEHEELIEFARYFSALNLYGMNTGLRPSNVEIQMVKEGERVYGLRPGAIGGITGRLAEDGEYKSIALITERVYGNLQPIISTTAHEISTYKLWNCSSLIWEILKYSQTTMSEIYTLDNRGEDFRTSQNHGLDTAMSIANEDNVIYYLKYGEFTYNPLHFTEIHTDEKGNKQYLDFMTYYTSDFFKRDLAEIPNIDNEKSIYYHYRGSREGTQWEENDPYFNFMTITTTNSDGVVSKNEHAFEFSVETLDGGIVSYPVELEEYLASLLRKGKIDEFDIMMANIKADRHTIEEPTEKFIELIYELCNPSLQTYILKNKEDYTRSR